MKRRIAWLMIALLLTNAFAFVGLSDGDHPISLSVLPDPNCEPESEGTIPFLTFTVRNHSDAPYTLHDATLSNGYESVSYPLESVITVEAGGTKEFTLNEVFIREDQFDKAVTYRLSWTERSTSVDAFGIPTEVSVPRSVEASVTVMRFIPPTLQLSAACDAEMVRMGETFSVRYSIVNDTKYDITSLVLTDPSATETVIPIPNDSLVAGETMLVSAEYVMGETDMQFRPVISYVVRQRQTETTSLNTLTVASCITSLRIDVQQYPTTKEGTTFALTITNDGNRTLTDIRLYDEIQTPIDTAFDLAPMQQKVLMYSIASAEDLDAIRTVRFHGTAVDAFGETITFTDDETYQCLPYILSEDVRLSLSVVLTDAYYDAEGSLCGKIQFTLSNYSEVTIVDAVLREENVLGTVAHYRELMRGDTYYTDVYKLDGIQSLTFILEAYDQAEQKYASDLISLDLSSLAALAERTEEDTVIYHSNTYLDDLLDRFTGLLNVTGIVIGIVAAVCGIMVLVLYLFERKLKAELPQRPAWTMHVRQESTETGRTLFDRNAAEQYGVVVPAKLRHSMQEEANAALPEQNSTAMKAPAESETRAIPIVPNDIQPKTQPIATLDAAADSAIAGGRLPEETIRIPIPMEMKPTAKEAEQSPPTEEAPSTDAATEQETTCPIPIVTAAAAAEPPVSSQSDESQRTAPKNVELSKPAQRRGKQEHGRIYRIS